MPRIDLLSRNPVLPNRESGRNLTRRIQRRRRERVNFRADCARNENENGLGLRPGKAEENQGREFSAGLPDRRKVCRVRRILCS